ncbi:hypothetical protein BV20DRAFT_812621 [Pilatotrama ljubarskyi]|nr:hypothetical protein BV20DRAFT_812621 [Pilatotrama ljubarskyi]
MPSWSLFGLEARAPMQVFPGFAFRRSSYYLCLADKAVVRLIRKSRRRGLPDTQNVSWCVFAVRSCKALISQTLSSRSTGTGFSGGRPTVHREYAYRISHKAPHLASRAMGMRSRRGYLATRAASCWTRVYAFEIVEPRHFVVPRRLVDVPD